LERQPNSSEEVRDDEQWLGIPEYGSTSSAAQHLHRSSPQLKSRPPQERTYENHKGESADFETTLGKDSALQHKQVGERVSTKVEDYGAHL